MKIAFTDSSQNCDVIILPCYNELEVKYHSSQQVQTESINQYILDFDFKAEKGEIARVSSVGNSPKVILCGIGHVNALNMEAFRKAIGKAIREANGLGAKNVAIDLNANIFSLFSGQDLIKAISETLVMASYQFNDFLSDSKNHQADEIGLVVDANNRSDASLNMGVVLGENTILARKLINKPANLLYPETLANSAVELGNQKGIDVSIISEKECAEMDMQAFLAVGRASDKRPKLIVMRWKGDESSDKTIGLVGKGVTYDTGGLSLKTTQFMTHMKSDMSGAAVSIATICALADLKVKKNVTVVVAACENNVDANAMKPGDIIGSMAGKTIEILNTDAEGRLTLADAIHYAIEKEGVDEVIDIATLTGAVKIALGEHRAAYVTNSESMHEGIMKASDETDELFWRLPMDDEYRSHVKSEVADIQNIGSGRLAGTISAAAFIEHFTQEKPWIHFDIAGVSFNRAGQEYISAGATGKCVRSLYHFISNM